MICDICFFKNTEFLICKCYKVHENYIKFDREKAENTKIAEVQKTSFSNKQVENADLHKPVLKKIMTTHK